MMMKFGDARLFRRATAIETGSVRASPESAGSASLGGGLARRPPEFRRSTSRAGCRPRPSRFAATTSRTWGGASSCSSTRSTGRSSGAVLDRPRRSAPRRSARRIDLAAYIRASEDRALATFPHDIATIVAMETGPARAPGRVSSTSRCGRCRLSFGYSIGELSALIFGGVFSLEQLLPDPARLRRDCAELAGRHDPRRPVHARGSSCPMEDVERLCLAISGEGKGLIGPSAYLSPNTALLLGQGDTLDRLERADPPTSCPTKTMLRRNPNRWPPLALAARLAAAHPEPDRRRALSDRGGPTKPEPTVLSCVTGAASYDESCNTRELLDPVDRPPPAALGRDRRDSGRGGRDDHPRRPVAQA